MDKLSIFDDIVDDFFSGMTNRAKNDWIKNNISSYATENTAELIAESFTAYNHPEFTKLPKDAREFIIKLLRPIL